MRRAAVLLGLTACFGQHSTLGLPCELDDQCDLGQRCSDELCIAVDGDTEATTVVSIASESGCGAPPIELALLPTRLVLVVESSFAANEPWDDDGVEDTEPVPRWTAIVASLADALPMIDGEVELGLVLAPTTNLCDVDGLAVPIAPDHAADVVAALPEHTGDGAPLVAALGRAYDALAATHGPGPRAVLLMMSGAANCDPIGELELADSKLTDAAAAARAAGIPTVVVGIDPHVENNTSEVDGLPDHVSPHETAIATAEAGGRSRPPDGYYRAQNGVTLGSLVRDALFAARGCALALPEGFVEGDSLVITIDGSTVPQLDACDGPGFVVGDDAIEMCGSWCDALKLGSTALASPCP